MATSWANPLLRPLLARAALQIVARLGQPALMLGPDLRVVLANDLTLQAFGLDRRDVVGRTIYQLADGALDGPGLRELLEHRPAGDETVQQWSLEADLPGIGHRVFQLSAAQIRGTWFDTGLTVLTFMDETDRTRAETRQSGMLEAAPDATIVVDEAGRIQLVNRQAVTMFGYAKEELLGEPVEMLVPDAVRHRHPGLRAGYLADPRIRPMAAGLELTARRKDGTECPVEISLSPIETVDGLLVVAAVRDITARRQAERQREELEVQLRDAQRLESVGRLAGGIAHDFNNLLTAIDGYAELALRGLDEVHPARPDVDEVRAAAQRGADLTRQLLAFSRRQVLQPAVVDVNAVIEDVVPMLRSLISDDIELIAVLLPDLGHVRADPTQLQQVIINLVLNGRDAMPDGGTLTIETINVDLDAAYASHHAEVTPGHYVEVAVSDTGVGIDPSVLGQVFEPFFTTKGPGAGTGLGLATVHGIVKQSGGILWVYSELGTGTTFKVYLPRVDEPVDLSAAPELRPVQGGTETILLVDDDDSVRSLMRSVLESYGYRVLVEKRGDDALGLASATADNVDLLVTDVVMPGLRGPELAARLTAMRPTLRVLYVSGYAENAIVHQGVLQPGLKFLARPFTSTDLARKVRELLDEPGG